MSFFILVMVVCVLLGIGPRALDVMGKHSATKLC